MTLPPSSSPMTSLDLLHSSATPVRITKMETVVADGTNVTALSALVASADQINLLYQVTTTSLGQFVRSINGYGPEGAAGWQYAVNGQIPQEAAANFKLKNGDKLQWFYGNPGISPY